MSVRERECEGSRAGLRLGREDSLHGLLAGPRGAGELGPRGGPKRERGQASRELGQQAESKGGRKEK